MYWTFLSPLVKVFLIGTSRFSVGIRGFPTYKVIQKLNFYTFSFPNFRIAFLIPNQALKQYLVNRKNYAKKTNKTLKKQMLHFPSPGLLSVTAPILTRAQTKFLPFCWATKQILPIPSPRPRYWILESLANTRATATAIWSSTIALILKDKGECKLHGLKRCAMP
jgi:hypothetical protein